jgi:hypothetical protein
MNAVIEKFYRDSVKRKYGIYSTGLDRFLLIDDLDVWITLETANLISSKVPNVVYLMPYEEQTIDNLNCINYGIRDKRSQKMGNTPLIFTTQTPVLRTLSGENVLKTFDNSPDILDSEMFDELKKYIDFVHQYSYAIKFTEIFTKYEETDSFSKQYLDNSTSASFKHTVERSGLTDSIYFHIRNALYISNSIEEAENKIDSLWKQHSYDIPFVKDVFYKILNKEISEDIKNMPQSFNYSNYSG